MLAKVYVFFKDTGFQGLGFKLEIMVSKEKGFLVAPNSLATIISWDFRVLETKCC